MQRELMGIRGIVGGLVETEQSSLFFKQALDGELSKTFTLSATCKSVANAVACKCMVRDFMCKYSEHLDTLNNTRLSDFLPKVDRIFSEEEGNALDEFLRIRDKTQWGQHYNNPRTLGPTFDAEKTECQDVDEKRCFLYQHLPTMQ